MNSLASLWLNHHVACFGTRYMVQWFPQNMFITNSYQILLKKKSQIEMKK